MSSGVLIITTEQMIWKEKQYPKIWKKYTYYSLNDCIGRFMNEYDRHTNNIVTFIVYLWTFERLNRLVICIHYSPGRVRVYISRYSYDMFEYKIKIKINVVWFHTRQFHTRDQMTQVLTGHHRSATIGKTHTE